MIKFVLVEPRNPKNIGASARGMANFGFRHLSVVNPYSVAWRETRSAVTAGPVVEQAKKFKSLKAALGRSHLVIGTSAGSRRGSDTALWIGLEELQTLVRANEKAKKNIALVFGSERSGLSNEDLAFCHYVLRIPTVAECPSMNLSQAVAVVACAIRADNVAALRTGAKPVEIAISHVDRLVGRALEACTNAGLLKGWDNQRSELRIRRSMMRWNLTEVDVAMLHGIFSWMIKKAR